MNKKGQAHLIISYIKSVIRLIGCAVSLNTLSIIPMCSCFLVAELLGILEEFVDKR